MTMLRLINFQSSTVSILSGGSWEGMKTEEKLFSALQRMSLKSYRTSQVTALTFQPRRELLTKTTQEDLMQSSSTAFRQQLSKEGVSVKVHHNHIPMLLSWVVPQEWLTC
jgi:predicted lipase